MFRCARSAGLRIPGCRVGRTRRAGQDSGKPQGYGNVAGKPVLSPCAGRSNRRYRQPGSRGFRCGIVSGSQNRTIGQTVYFDGHEHLLEPGRIEPLAAGPVFAQLRISGRPVA